jgi:hypothetical protein
MAEDRHGARFERLYIAVSPKFPPVHVEHAVAEAIAPHVDPA